MARSQHDDQQDHEGAADSTAAHGEQRLGSRGADRSDVTHRTYRGTDEPAPRRPDERDESADSQASAPRPVIERAHDDLAEGQVDTDPRSREAGALMRRLREDDAQNSNAQHAEDGT